MTRAVKRTPRKAASSKPVSLGDVVKLEGNGIAVLPDGSAVTCRGSYVIRHVGLHIIGGVSYLAS